MLKKKLIVILVLTALATFSSAQESTSPSPDSSGDQIISQGKDNYQQARYQEAINNFRELLVNPSYINFQGDAYFWVAKSLLAIDRLDDAARNFEYFIANFSENQNVPEAVYQRGRILYLQSEYAAAIQAFAKFLETYPKSIYVPNAYYWTGEALYSMGQLDEAQKMFKIVIQEFPTSYRIEAARYRVSLIDLRNRETQLLELLKWSHQENIKNLEDFQKQIKVYEEAILSYQKRLASLGSDDFKQEVRILQDKADSASAQLTDAQTRITELNTQIRALQGQVQDMQNQRDAALSQVTDLQGQMQKPLVEALTELDQKEKLLDAKEQALELKEQALKSGGDN